jgi:copper chaperone CopZ
MKKILVLAMLLALGAPPAQAHHGGKHILVAVNGLVCDFCAVAMKKVFLKKKPVAAVDVNLTSKVVTIDLKQGETLSDDDIKKGITDAGYVVVNIKRD